MHSRTAILVLICLLAHTGEGVAQLFPNLGGQRVGISAFQSLKIGVGARGVGMGESFVAVANDVSSLYWNPAGLVQGAEDEAMASHTEYVADINHDFFGVAFHLTSSDVVGAAFSSLHMKDMEITTETQPFGTGRYFTFGDVSVGLTYSRKMTDQFSFGATVRYVEETLDVLKMRSLMVDLGTYYWTGLGSARFAVVIANFGADVAPKGTVADFSGESRSTFQAFSLPTVFKLGFAFEPVDDDGHRLTASVQLNHPNDNAEHLRFGLEYGWQNTAFLRMGLKRTIGQKLFGEDATSEESYSVGAGVRVPVLGERVEADYAFAQFSRLGAIHRISIAFTY
jgi:hypothetical protein